MNIGIVGLGLIGGSLGLDFRAQGHRVLGVSRQAETGDRAIALGAIDATTTELSLLHQAEVIFICTPLAAMAATVQALVPHLSPATVLTDVGSVKGWVVETIAPLWHNFVGGHPMAGTANRGIEAAQRNLFVNAAYVLTPTAQTPSSATRAVEDLVRPLQTQIFHCDPEVHDRAVAWISHLPVIASASLIAACATESDQMVLELAKALASSGFRDTSRVGGGNPELGVMMAQYNKTALLRSLSSYRDTVDQLIAQIEQEDWQALDASLQATQTVRSQFVKP
jgi:arogenate dehydrogenase (NADP+)